MPKPVEAITFGWRDHPDLGLYTPDPEPIPDLLVRLAAHEAYSHYIGLLRPKLRYTVFPLPAAFEIPGLVPADLERVEDPELGSSPLWDYRTQPLLVFGDDPAACLRIRTPVAIDSTGRLRTVLLGGDVHSQVRIALQPGGPNKATLRPR